MTHEQLEQQPGGPSEHAQGILYQDSEPLNVEKGSSMYSRDRAEKAHRSSASKVESTQNQSQLGPKKKKCSLREQVDRKIKSSKGDAKGSSVGPLGGRRKSNKLSILHGIAVNQSMQALNVSGFQAGMGRLQEMGAGGSLVHEQQQNSRLYINTGLSSGYSQHEQNNLNHHQGYYGGPAKPCLEDHRLLVDCAIDRLKGELLEKDREEIQPLVLRQKKLQEQQMLNHDAVDKRISDLERMVALQDQTIRCLLDINSKQLAMKEAP